MNRYVLDDAGNPVEEPSLERWGRWMQDADRAVGKAEAERTHAIVVEALKTGRDPWEAVEAVSDAG